jgi:hypothetical protein
MVNAAPKSKMPATRKSVNVQLTSEENCIAINGIINNIATADKINFSLVFLSFITPVLVEKANSKSKIRFVFNPKN